MSGGSERAVPGDDEAEALRRENARLRERTFEAERRLQRLEVELREIKQSGALRIGRLVSRLLPSGLKHRLYDPFRRAEPLRLDGAPAVEEGPPAALAPVAIRLSLVVPVYGHARHLPEMIDSLLSQTRPAEEIILVDDASPDPAVGEVLSRYAHRGGVQVLRNEKNLGISATTNRGIAAATGTYLAFVDCDDALEPAALQKVEAFLAAHPGVDFLYTDRIDVDEDGHELQRWGFAERAARPPLPELLEGMFTSHLKVVSRAAFRDVGLFKPRYDLTQDYDLALRLAERRRLAHLPEAVYRHRIHGEQQSQQQQQRQEQALERVRRDSLRRSSLRGAGAPRVSVVVEGSGTDEEVRRTQASLRRLEGRPELVSRGRPRGDYVLRVAAGAQIADGAVLSKMLERLEASPELGACCAKVTRRGRILSSGGQWSTSDGFAIFTLDEQGRDVEDLGTLEERRCDWLPPGLSLWRLDVARRFAPSTALVPALRAQELAIRLREGRVEVGNCPTAEVEWSGHPGADDPVQILASLRSIFQTHRIVVRDDGLYRAMGWDTRDVDGARARITRSD